jgi:hypothetical protein
MRRSANASNLLETFNTLIKVNASLLKIVNFLYRHAESYNLSLAVVVN